MPSFARNENAAFRQGAKWQTQFITWQKLGDSKSSLVFARNLRATTSEEKQDQLLRLYQNPFLLEFTLQRVPAQRTSVSLNSNLAG